MSNVIKFKPKSPKDIYYIVRGDGELEGISGKNVYMVSLKGDDGFLFNDEYISRDELVAFILVTGLWQDFLDKDI